MLLLVCVGLFFSMAAAMPNLGDIASNPMEGLEFSFEGSQNCDGVDVKIKMDDMLLEQLGMNKMAISGNLTLDITLDENLILVNTISKCPSKSERGKCQDYPPKTITDICEKLPENGQPWSEFVGHLHEFTPRCPVKPGRYSFVRYPVDMESLANMPFIEGYWMLTAEGLVGNEKVLCVNTEVSFEKVSSRKRKKNKSG